jgi:hypothetical protein
MPNEVLRDTVISVLGSPDLLPIGFELNGLCVTGMRFLMVREAVVSKITCEIGIKKTPGDQLPSGSVARAQYIPWEDQFRFPRETFGQHIDPEKVTIVHEATHAIFDLYAATKDDRVAAIDDEAAAFLAAALYSRLAQVSPGMMIEGDSKYEALQLADKILAETGDFKKDKRTYFLKAPQIAKLRAAVVEDYDLKESRAGIVDIMDQVPGTWGRP